MNALWTPGGKVFSIPTTDWLAAAKRVLLRTNLVRVSSYTATPGYCSRVTGRLSPSQGGVHLLAGVTGRGRYTLIQLTEIRSPASSIRTRV